MVRAHAYRDTVRPCLCNLNTLNHRLSWHACFIDKVSAANLKDELTSGEIGSTIGDRVTPFKGQPVSIGFLDDTNSFAHDPPISVAAGEIRTDVDLALHRAGKTVGTVSGANGNANGITVLMNGSGSGPNTCTATTFVVVPGVNVKVPDVER